MADQRRTVSKNRVIRPMKARCEKSMGEVEKAMHRLLFL